MDPQRPEVAPHHWLLGTVAGLLALVLFSSVPHLSQPSPTPRAFLHGAQVLVGIDFVTYYFISCLYIDY